MLAREKALYGGPDRHETWYDWSDLGAPFDVEMPPEGRIVELDLTGCRTDRRGPAYRAT